MRPIVLFIYVIAFTLCSCRTTIPTETVRTAALHDTVTVIRRDTVYHTDTLHLTPGWRGTISLRHLMRHHHLPGITTVGMTMTRLHNQS